jgi:hypothetical protein
MTGGELSCPEGYDQYEVAFFLTCDYYVNDEERWNDAHLYMCLNPKVYESQTTGVVAGGYMITPDDSDGDKCTVNNPFTGSTNCPEGFSSEVAAQFISYESDKSYFYLCYHQ